MISIESNSIQVQAVIDAASTDSAGAINAFIGTIRDSTGARKVIYLEYEAYESMALSEIAKILDNATKKWEILGFGISHRIGRLKPGEVAVVVAVSTRHRKESFEACQYIIDSLKQSVPIFKKEVYEDGENWIGA